MALMHFHNSLTRAQGGVRADRPRACAACMSAARRSMTSRISAMRGRRSSSTCCSGSCGGIYPRVTYVRNITDVDDKINARAKESGEPIEAITARTTADYHRDMAALGCLPPTAEPRATASIAPMIALIERLIARGHAYAAEGHVLFSVPSFPEYGALSGRDRGRTARRRADRRRALQARSRRLRAVEALAAGRARLGQPLGAAAARAGTSSAPPCRGRRWARCSTSMAAATTWSSRTTRTRWRRAAAPSARRAWRMSGCTTACCAWTARRCRSRSATSRTVRDILGARRLGRRGVPPAAAAHALPPGDGLHLRRRWRRPRRSSTTATPCWRARRRRPEAEAAQRRDGRTGPRSRCSTT